MDELDVYNSSDEDEKKVMMDADLDVDDSGRFFGGDELMEQNYPMKNDHYAVLSEADLRRRMEDAISKVSAVLSVSKGESSILLGEFKWNVQEVTAAWFSGPGENEVRKRVGLFKNPVPVQFLDESKEIGCAICSGSLSSGGLTGGNCVHPFCRGCLADQIGIQINDASGSSTIRCPESSCGAALSEDAINGVLTEEQRANYSRFLLRTFVEHIQSMKWCPIPGCNYAIDFDLTASRFDVSCLNSHSFCWNCLGEVHRPVDCKTVKDWADWISTITNPEIKTENKLLMDTIQCPQCTRLYEKPTNVHSMTCVYPCNFEFCLRCLERYRNHEGDINHFCHEFSVARVQLESQMESANKIYNCYDGWVDNEILKLKAVSELEALKTEDLSQKRHTEDLSVLVEAWEEIVKSRQIVKWSCVCRFFIPEEGNNDVKIELFNYWKDQAVASLESLQSYAERNVVIRPRLLDLIKDTRMYFENLVSGLENHHEDVKAI